MKLFFKRLFCLHSSWSRPFIWKNSAGWAFYGFEEFECINCGKRRLFNKNEPPINYEK